MATLVIYRLTLLTFIFFVIHTYKYNDEAKYFQVVYRLKHLVIHSKELNRV